MDYSVEWIKASFKELLYGSLIRGIRRTATFQIAVHKLKFQQHTGWTLLLHGPVNCLPCT